MLVDVIGNSELCIHPQLINSFLFIYSFPNKYEIMFYFMRSQKTASKGLNEISIVTFSVHSNIYHIAIWIRNFISFKVITIPRQFYVK